MLVDHVQDDVGSISISEPGPGVIEVCVRGRLSTRVGEVFPRYAAAAARRQARCSVFLDVRDLRAFDGPVRAAWVQAVIEHRAQLDEVVVVSRDLLVTLTARAAAVALAAMGLRFEVLTDARRYSERLASAVRPLSTPRERVIERSA